MRLRRSRSRVAGTACLGIFLLSAAAGCMQALSDESGSVLGPYEAGSVLLPQEAGSVLPCDEAGSSVEPRRTKDRFDPTEELRFDDAPGFFDPLPAPKPKEVPTEAPGNATPLPVSPPRGELFQRRVSAVVALAANKEAPTKPAPDGDVRLTPPGPESWPSFRNGNAQLGIATTKLPDELELKWKFEATDGVPGTASIVGGRVYIGLLKGDLVCLDLKNGKLIWSYRSIADADPNAFAPGFKGGSLVTADTVYIGDEDGVLHAVERATGKKRWTFQTDAEIAGCPAIVDGRIIIGSHDTYLYCLNAADGKEVWKFQTQDRVNCSPAVVDGFTFVAGCDEHLRVIDVGTGKEKADILLGTYLIASPAVMNEMLYVGNYAGEVVAVDWKQEQVAWKYKDPQREFPYHGSAAVTDKLVVAGGRDKQMHAIDRKTGEGVWTFPTRGRIDSSPAIVGDRVYFGSSDRNIYGLRLSDGKEIWKFNAEGEVTSSPAIGEGHLVIGSEGSQGFVFCFGGKDS